MDRVNKKKPLFFIVFAIIMFLMGMGGITYAYFYATISGTVHNTTIIADILTLEYTDGTTTITASNLKPGDIVTKTITVKNTSTSVVHYSVFWQNVTNTFVDQTDLDFKLYGTTNGSNQAANIAFTQAPNTTAKSYIQQNIALGSNETHTYIFSIRWTNKSENQNDNQGASFSGQIFVEEYVTP